MGDSLQAAIQSAAGATVDDLLRLERANADQMGQLLSARLERQDITAAEVRALAEHRKLRTLT